MTRTWFVDTGFVIAMASPRDQFHAVAGRLFQQVDREAIRLVTSQAIILEIGASFSRLSFRPSAVRLIEAMRVDPNVEVVPLTDALLERAF